jgi:hypothetical protein
MNSILYLLGLYAFVAQTGTSFTPLELNLDFRSFLLFSLRNSCTRLIINLTREKQEHSRHSVGNTGCKNVIAVIFQLKYMCQK